MLSFFKRKIMAETLPSEDSPSDSDSANSPVLPSLPSPGLPEADVEGDMNIEDLADSDAIERRKRSFDKYIEGQYIDDADGGRVLDFNAEQVEYQEYEARQSLLEEEAEAIGDAAPPGILPIEPIPIEPIPPVVGEGEGEENVEENTPHVFASGIVHADTINQQLYDYHDNYPGLNTLYDRESMGGLSRATKGGWLGSAPLLRGSGGYPHATASWLTS
jgi:hypothetical protein